MRWEGYVAHTEARINLFKILVDKPEGKRPFETLRR
jgi:hypothetical protein